MRVTQSRMLRQPARRLSPYLATHAFSDFPNHNAAADVLLSMAITVGGNKPRL